MLPQNENVELELTYKTNETKTHFMNIDQNSIYGFVDEKEALKQAIFKILNTQRNKYLMYSRNYGIDIDDLFGEQISYVKSQLEERIVDALSIDERIIDVYDFNYTDDYKNLAVTFKVKSIYGELTENYIYKKS